MKQFKMKEFTLAIIFLFVSGYSWGQKFGSAYFAQNYATFKYRNSSGNRNEFLATDIKPSYGFNFNKVYPNGLFHREEIGYKNNGGISMLSNNERVNWSLHYLDLNVGGGYMFKKFKIKPYAGFTFYSSFLFKADQIIGSKYFNLLDNRSIKRFDYGLNSFIGLQYPFLLQHVPFTEYVAFFVEYRNTTGLHQLERNQDGVEQKLFNRVNSFNFGVSFFMKDAPMF